MKREELSGMKVLDAAFKNLVKCVGLSLQDGKKSFSAMILLFFFLESVLPMILWCKKHRADVLPNDSGPPNCNRCQLSIIEI